MKISSLFVAFIIVISNNSSQALTIDDRDQLRSMFPKVEQVLTHLNNKLQYRPKEGFYGVAKKREGYYLTITNYKTLKVNEFLVWSMSEMGFVNYDISEFINETMPHSSTNVLGDIYRQHKKYDYLLFYGYKDWPKDVIDLLKPYESGLTAQDLETLAHAYGDLALDDVENLNRIYAPVPKEQAENFASHAHQSMSYWRRIKEVDKNYTPLAIKNLDLKIGNEYMHFYNSLMSMQEPKLANEFLEKAWYTPSQVQSAKNQLYACGENAILFTSGDNDTFPLWYVQAKLKYRTDVAVINTSLLTTPWYFEMNKQKYGLKSIMNHHLYPLFIDKAHLADLAQPETPFKQWLENKLSKEDTSSLSYEFIPGSMIIKYKDVNMTVKFRQNKYIASYDIAILDLISSNPQRDFNFGSIFLLYDYGLNGHYLSRGKSSQLVPEALTDHSDKETVRQLDNLLYYMDINYLSGFPYTGAYEANSISYAINGLAPDLKDDKDRLSKMFIEHLPASEVIAIEDYDLTDVVNSFLDETNPELSLALRKEAKTLVIEHIRSMSSLDKDIDQNILDLNNIFSIYAGVQPQWLKYHTAINLVAVDKEVLTEMKLKIDQLMASPVFDEYQWTRQKFGTISTALDELELE